MKGKTKYSYQKRINQLERENSTLSEKLYLYKDVCDQINQAVQNCLRANDNSNISKSWLVGQFRRLWR